MIYTLAIDPGTTRQGWALFGGVQLAECGINCGAAETFVLKSSVQHLRSFFGVARAVIEGQEIHRGGRFGKVSPATIIRLAQSAGMVAGVLQAITQAPVEFVLPSVWKGGVPKGPHQERIVNALFPKEKEVLDVGLSRIKAKTHHSEVIDAVGIGLWAVGRKV